MGETNVVEKHKLIFCLKLSAIGITLIITTSMFYRIILAGLNQVFFLVNEATLTA